MRIHLRHLHHRPSASFTAFLEKQLHALGVVRQIDEARVQLEHRAEGSPPFRVALHLVTPGPDIAAEAVDHTLRAALAKVVAELETKIKDREANRTPRARGNLQAPVALRPGAKPGAKPAARR